MEEIEIKENQEPAAAAAAAEADRGRRTEKIGIVTSDAMQKSVVVRVDRLVKHPVYKRYVRRRTKFMAHNEIEGVSSGDLVRIVETRPLSARKRWRVVEVLRKASK
ncbi:MAG: 30S ribosomal protein S17 [Acidobacteria bacterium]|nr:30S ribosomal protein S17 [Acidobacteriota bacterium]